MIFDVYCESIAGHKPKKYTEKNQDSCAYGKNKKYCCLCLADGAGSKKYSSLGANCLVHDVCDYLMDNAAMLLEEDSAKIRSQAVLYIRDSLKKTAEQQNVNYSELSSTLMCFLTDGRKYLTIHLGDGVILAERDGCLNVLSFPMNGDSKRSTALTTMMNFEHHLRVCKETCELISIVWMMTDGAMYEVFQENYGLGGEKLSVPMIRGKLLSANDDATYGYIKWRK